ncbi:MAG: glycoside hydrolase family 9 protein [candidate division KSB1 bacterium]|nr:glycoside hydrolase family 9 protein [candidate division KSB1 bacterium]
MKYCFCKNIFLLFAVLFSWKASFAEESLLKLNDKDYFEMPGFNVLAFENAYTGMFFDEKTSGIILIHHGVRTATGGAVRLKPTPEQWDQIPRLVERKVNREENSVEITLRYDDLDFTSRVVVSAQGRSAIFRVYLDQPLPEKLVERAGFNLEFLPSAYFEKTYRMDSRTGIFPLYPCNSMEVKPMTTQIRQYAGHSTFDDRGRGEYVEPKPFAQGKELTLAPEDPERCITIRALLDGELQLFDGRSVAQNGWYVVRTLLPTDRTGLVVEWQLTPTTLPDWKRRPMIAYSQVGYHPTQPKTAVIELDKNDVPQQQAVVHKLEANGQWVEKYRGRTQDWGDFYRYHYLRFDFSSLREEGIYRIQYGDEQSGPFLIGAHVFEGIWHSTLDVWFPVQMDHMFVNEAYRVWHGAAHLDDALQAPINHQHFDGYRMGESTETRYQPGERVPGLNIGGWFDAGDFDIRTGSHCATVMHMVHTWERFLPQRDETLVDQTQRFVDIHHPDGKPDLLQQIEQGALALIAQHRAFGRAVSGIIEPHLHQYHHLGDASTITDNLPYNPNLKPYESDGLTSGTPDDRWVFTNDLPWNNYASIAALAAASRALRGYHDALAEECLAAAQKAFAEEQKRAQEGYRVGPFGLQSAGLQAALELYISTGNPSYAAAFDRLLWPELDRSLNRLIKLAVQALPYRDRSYRKKLLPFVQKYKAYNDELLKQNPFGVPITTGGWAGNSAVIDWAETNYLLHKAFPEVIGQEYTFRGLDYIFGCHPYSNISFVSGVGMRSKKVAYGNNRADYTFIAGGVVPGLLLIKPDFLENKEDWPFLWGENEYVIDICAHYILLAHAAQDLVK